MPTQTIRTTGAVIRRPRYAALTAAVTALSYSLFASILNYRILLSSLGETDFALFVGLIHSFTTGYHVTMPPTTVGLTVLISIGVGVNAALALFKAADGSGLTGSDASAVSGFGIAALAPACTTCLAAGAGLAGFGTVLGMLPYGGITLNVVALGILGVSAYWMAGKIHADDAVCELC